MEKEIAVREPKALASIPPPVDLPLNSDLVIPYLLLAQASSDSVKARKAQIGDFVRSTNMEILGSVENPIEIIFLHMPKTFWRIDQKVPGSDNKWKFFKAIPRNSTNEVMDFKFTGDKDGNPVADGSPNSFEYRRFKQFRVFALLPSDVIAAQVEREKAMQGALPDVSKALTPVMLSFQSSSGYQCGRDITSFATKAMTFNVPVWRYILKLTGHLETVDNNTFYCWDLTGNNPAKPVEPSDLEEVRNWAAIVTGRGDQLKTDEAAENTL